MVTSQVAARISLILGVVLAIFAVAVSSPNVHALPPGFSEVTVFSGLQAPTAVRFASNGNVFVAQKDGQIFRFTSISNTNRVQTADLRADTFSDGDMGLLGLAVHPQYGTGAGKDFIYALYTRKNSVFPSGRLLKITVNPTTGIMTSSQVLIDGWCQMSNSHSIGDLQFGPDGALYVSGGEGADHDNLDYGQIQSTEYPGQNCQDPAREGGSMRAQDMQTTSDPLGVSGAILRINPDTGLAMVGNPFFGDPDVNKSRIIAYGERNPYRFTVNQVTGEVWTGNTGSFEWEEINRIPNPTDSVVENFGWPCYEGNFIHPGWQQATNAANLTLCKNLYALDTTTKPYMQLNYSDRKSESGITFYYANKFPAQYNGALFLADATAGYRGLDPIRVIFAGANGLPNASTMTPFSTTFSVPTDLQVGPDGFLYYTDLQFSNNDKVKRIQYFGATQPPVAVITANRTSGPAPLSVLFSAANSTDADVNDTLTFTWDLDNDGLFDDATGVTATRTFTAGSYQVRLQARDTANFTSIATILISAGNSPPVATINAPTNITTYQIGNMITFSGSGFDPETGALPPSSYSWKFILQHCSPVDPNACHSHEVTTINGVTNGTIPATGLIDHEFPSFLNVQLTVTEAGQAAQNWFDTNWQYRKKLTINNAGINTAITDFPVLVKLNSSTVNYSRIAANGADLRFVDGNNVALAYEIESWNTTGTSTVWVKVPQIDAAPAVDFIYLYYGNAAASSAQNPAGVWSNGYNAVYHMQKNGLVVSDSSGNGRNAAISGNAAAATGTIGGAINFDGIDDFVDTNYNGNLGADSWAISLWAKESPTITCAEGDNIFTKEWDYRIYLKETCVLGFITGRTDGSDAFQFEYGEGFQNKGWHHIVYAWDKPAGVTRVYFDGVLDTTGATQFFPSSDPTLTNPANNTADYHIGGAGGANMYFEGAIDEVSISRTLRSPAWVAAQFRSESGSLFAAGAEETQSQSGGVLLSDTKTVSVHPKTVSLLFNSNVQNTPVTVYGLQSLTPFNREVIIGAGVDVIAPSTQVVGPTTYSFLSWSDGGAQLHQITAPATATTYTATYSSSNPSNNTTGTHIRVKTSSGTFVDSQGNTWVSDAPYVIGSASGTFTNATSISGTVDDALYQSERFSTAATGLQYGFAVPNGAYNVTLHFAEVWGGNYRVGARVFDASVEGVLAANDLDIYANVGGAAALTRNVIVNVTDGNLAVALTRVVENPKISAIEIHSITTSQPPAQLFTLRVNAGGPSYVDGLGRTWSPDSAYVIGSASGAFTNATPISGTTDDALYQSERFSSAPGGLSYGFTVPNGLYNVTLHFAEVWGGNYRVGARVFDASVEGVLAANDLDIYANVGGAAALTRNVVVNVTDGNLAVALTRVTENPKISAIEIVQLPSGAVQPPTPFDLYLNAGGGSFTDSLSHVWVSDASYVVGASNTFVTASAISGTTDDTLYQSERYSTATATGLQYAIPVPNGNYSVTFRFAEIYTGAFANGARVFDVNLENVLAIDNLDIFAQVGGNAAYSRTVSTTVTDGSLSIRFVHGVENPKISAIEIHRV